MSSFIEIIGYFLFNSERQAVSPKFLGTQEDCNMTLEEVLFFYCL